jgi:hypothetical protein
MNKKPFVKGLTRKNGLFYLFLPFLAFLLTLSCVPLALASDGATEALQLRYYAEVAITQEEANGNRDLAQAMRHSLPGLLQEYLATRDGTIALDTVDAAFVDEQFKVAQAMEEPGVALALDVFSGPGTGFEHGLRTSLANLANFHERMAGKVSNDALDATEKVIQNQLAKLENRSNRLDARLNAASSKIQRFTLTVNTKGVNLSVTPSQSVSVETKGATVEVTPGSGPATVTPGNGNSAAGFSGGSPGNSGNAGGGRSP